VRSKRKETEMQLISIPKTVLKILLIIKKLVNFFSERFILIKKDIGPIIKIQEREKQIVEELSLQITIIIP